MERIEEEIEPDAAIMSKKYLTLIFVLSLIVLFCAGSFAAGDKLPEAHFNGIMPENPESMAAGQWQRLRDLPKVFVVRLVFQRNTPPFLREDLNSQGSV